MRGDDLEPGEAVEGPFEDQVLQGDGCVERIADRVRQPAIALEALGEFRRTLRMDEQNGAEFFGLGPNGMEFWDRKNSLPARWRRWRRRAGPASGSRSRVVAPQGPETATSA